MTRYSLSTAVMLTAIANATAAAPLTAEHFEVPPPVVMVRASGMPDLPPLPPSIAPATPAKATKKSARIATPTPPPAEKGLELEFSVRIPDPAPTVAATEAPLESNSGMKAPATSGRHIVSVPPVMVAAPAAPQVSASAQTAEVLHKLVADQLTNKASRLLSASVVAPGQLTQLLDLARQVSQIAPTVDVPVKTDATESLAYDLAQQKFDQQLRPTLEQPVLDTRVLTALFSAATPWRGARLTHVDKSASLLEDLYQSRWEASLNPVLSAPLMSRELLLTMMADFQQLEADAKAQAVVKAAPELPSAVEHTADIYLPMDCAAYEPSRETVEVEYQIRRGGAIERKVTERPARIVTDFEIKPGDSLRKTLSAWAPPGHLVFWEATPKEADLVFNAPAHFGKDRQAAIQRLMATVTQVTGLTLKVFENNVSAVRGSIPNTVCRSAYK